MTKKNTESKTYLQIDHRIFPSSIQPPDLPFFFERQLDLGLLGVAPMAIPVSYCNPKNTIKYRQRRCKTTRTYLRKEKKPRWKDPPTAGGRNSKLGPRERLQRLGVLGGALDRREEGIRCRIWHDEEEQVAVGINERDARLLLRRALALLKLRQRREAVTGSVRRPERKREGGKEVRRP